MPGALYVVMVPEVGFGRREIALGVSVSVMVRDPHHIVLASHGTLIVWYSHHMVHTMTLAAVL